MQNTGKQVRKRQGRPGSGKQFSRGLSIPKSMITTIRLADLKAYRMWTSFAAYALSLIERDIEDEPPWNMRPRAGETELFSDLNLANLEAHWRKSKPSENGRLTHGH